MFGELQKELDVVSDIMAYKKFKEIFRRFTSLCKTEFDAERGYAVSDIYRTSVEFALFDRISVIASFSMVVNEARTKRSGRLVFTKQDIDEPKIIWVIYFDADADTSDTPYIRTGRGLLNMLKKEDLGRMLVRIIDRCGSCFEVVE